MIKYLGINLTKEINFLYIEKYKMLKKEIEENKNILGDIPCSWIKRIDTFKMSILTNAIYRFNIISINILENLQQLKNTITKFTWYNT
jgi:hypothetical protein